MLYTEMSTKDLIILQDTRNKNGKQVRTAVEAGAKAAGTTIMQQSQKIGDYTLLTPDIKRVLKNAYEARCEELREGTATDELYKKFLMTGKFTDEQAREAAFISMDTFTQNLRGDNSIPAGTVYAVKGDDLLRLSRASVETKWRTDELKACLSDATKKRRFESELEYAQRMGYQFLVLIVTDEKISDIDIRPLSGMIKHYGAYLDICPEQRAFYLIENFLRLGEDRGRDGAEHYKRVRKKTCI